MKCSFGRAIRRREPFKSSAHSPPWYVRRASLLGDNPDHVMVLVLVGIERDTKSARFFVAKNSDLTAQFRQTSNWKDIHEPRTGKPTDILNSTRRKNTRITGIS